MGHRAAILMVAPTTRGRTQRQNRSGVTSHEATRSAGLELLLRLGGLHVLVMLPECATDCAGLRVAPEDAGSCAHER